MAPAPPPPPLCLPFRSKKPKRVTTLAHSEKGSYGHHSYGSFPDSQHGSNYDLRRQDSFSPSPTSTVNTKTSFAKSGLITEDSESYDVPLPVKEPSPGKPKRGDSKKWGYGWGVGKEKDLDKYSASSMVRRDSGGSTSSGETLSAKPPSPGSPDRPNVSRQSSSRSNATKYSPRPGIHGNDSSSTLVGSALERKINDVESVREKVDTGPRLEDLRKQMAKDNLDY